MIWFKCNENLDEIEELVQFQENVLKEIRYREQGYFCLQVLLNNISYYDFFSQTAFQFIKEAVYISQLLGRKLNIDLLYSLCLLLTYSINWDSFYLFDYDGNSVYDLNDLKKDVETLQKNENKIKIQEDVFSDEIHEFFYSVCEIAIQKFKVPLITHEMLILCLFNAYFEMNREEVLEPRYFFRTVVTMQTNMISNTHLQYFYYLLSTKNECLSSLEEVKPRVIFNILPVFRNLLMRSVVKTNIFRYAYEKCLRLVAITK